MGAYRIGIVDYQHADWQGGRNYILNLKAALLHTALAHPFPFDVIDLDDGAPKRGSLRERLSNRLSFWSGIRQPQLHRAIKKARCDFAYYCGTGTRARVGYKSAHWIADFQSIAAPEFSPPEYVIGSRSYIESVLRDSQRVVLSSRNARGHCADMFPQFLSKTEVLPFRATRMLSIATRPPVPFDMLKARYGIPERYFIVCNQFWRNKNHIGIFRAAEILSQRGTDVTIVCTGQVRDNRDPGYAAEILDQLNRGSARRSIKMLGKVSVDDLYGLMRYSLAVIQPSFFEGWSTSVEEARCLGKTTILSDIAVHREQASPYARYFAPDSAESLAEQVSSLSLETDRAGWDVRGEAEAAAAYLPLVLEFARSFLRIARD